MSFSTKEVFDVINKRIKNLKKSIDYKEDGRDQIQMKNHSIKELESLRKELKTH